MSPLSWIYRVIILIPAGLYRLGFKTRYQPPVPVWVVGNLTVGGNGKSMLVQWLVSELKARNYQVAIISRGYGGSAKSPLFVSKHTYAQCSGDEPLMLFEACQCPVVICQNRAAAIQMLLKEMPHIDLIISDDGLQHLTFKATLQLNAINAHRQYGNQKLLPIGPLRAPLNTLDTVDALVYISQVGQTMQIDEGYAHLLVKPSHFYPIQSPKHTLNAVQLKSKQLNFHAVTAIAHAERFFSMLESLGLCCQTHSYPDHYLFESKDFESYTDTDLIIMTAKDAVKCKPFATGQFWVLSVSYVPNERLKYQFKQWVKGL